MVNSILEFSKHRKDYLLKQFTTSLRNSTNRSSFLAIFGIGFIWLCAFLLAHKAPEWDNMEELVWSSSFEWGYQKHPPLPTWIMYPLTMVFGKVIWLPFLVGFLCVIAMHLFCYALYLQIAQNANQALPKYASLIAILTVSPVAYFTLRGGDFNHNAAQLWSIAAMFLFYYKAWHFERMDSATTKDAYLNWVFMGVFAGLAMVTKYSVLIQIAVMGLHFIWAGRWRYQRSWIGVILALMAFLLVTGKHFSWLYDQTMLHQGPIYYAQNSMAQHGGFWNQVVGLFLNFTMTQVYRLLPILLVIWMIRKMAKGSELQKESAFTGSWWQSVRHDDQQFLWMIGIGPTVVALLIGVFLQKTIEAKWAVTFYIYFGFIGWLFVRNEINSALLTKRVIAGHILFAGIYVLATGPIADYIGHQGRSNFPSEAFAKRIYANWEAHPELTKGEPLQMVVGDTWIIGNVILHDPVHHGKEMKGWIDADDLSSPWITPMDKKKPLMVLIDHVPKPSGMWWRAGHPPSLAVIRLFEVATVKGVEEIPWTSNPKAPPLEIQWAILPADDTR